MADIPDELDEGPEEPLDDLLAAVVPAPEAETEFNLDDIQLERLTDDLAREIHDRPAVAKRYGLTMMQLYRLLQIPAVLKAVQAKFAAWNSDAAAVDRLQTHWQIGMIEAAPQQIAAMMDPNTPAATRLEYAKLGLKLSGVEAAQKKAGDVIASQTAPFAVNIHFANGHRETIDTVAIEPAPAALS